MAGVRVLAQGTGCRAVLKTVGVRQEPTVCLILNVQDSGGLQRAI